MKGKKTGGSDFKVGNPGGPGRPALPAKIKKLHKLTVEEFEQITSVLLYSNEQTLKDIFSDPTSSYLKRIVVQILFKTLETGNMAQFDLLLSRVIGKVKEKFEHEIIKPSILVKRDGTHVIFSHKAIDDEDDGNGGNA